MRRKLFLTLMTLLSLTASAEVVDGITYWFEGTEATAAYAQSRTGSINIPATVDYEGTTYKVTAIKDHAFDAYEITSITIGANVRTIGAYAFNYAQQLETVTFAPGSQLRTIGDYAFCNCTKMTTINLPSGVTSIGKQAFYMCRALTAIDIPASLTTLREQTFLDCDQLTSVVIPEGVQTIEDKAFSGCDGMTTVSIPQSVTSISGTPFYGCSGLTDIAVDAANSYFCSVDGSLYDKSKTRLINFALGQAGAASVPEGVTEISKRAFYRATKMTTVSLPSTLRTIGVQAFSFCSALTDITIPEGVSVVSGSTFEYCSALKTVHLPSTITVINSAVFMMCPQLTDLTLDATTVPTTDPIAFYTLDVTKITLHVPASAVEAYKADDVWKSFKGLNTVYTDGSTFTVKTAEGTDITVMVTDNANRKVQIGDGVSAAVDATLSGTVTIPAIAEGYDVTAIGENAFQGCALLTAVDMPSAVNTIKTGAFQGCAAFSAVSIPQNTDVQSGAFSSCDALATVTCCTRNAYNIAADAFSSDIYSRATLRVEMDRKEDFLTATGWKEFATIHGYLTENVRKFYVNSVEGVEIGFSVADVDAQTIQVGGPETDDYPTIAIDTRTTKITIPESIDGLPVVKLAKNAFKTCTSLTEVNLPNTITAIGTNAFLGCEALEYLTLPASVNSLEIAVFSGCKNMKVLDMKHTSLSGVTVGRTTSGNPFNGMQATTVIYLPETCSAGTEQNVVTGNVCNHLKITDKGDIVLPHEFTASLLTYSRYLNQSTKDAYTVCLPFEKSTDRYVKYYRLTSGGSSWLTFTEETSPEANTPYLAVVQYGRTESCTSLADVTISKSVDNSITVDGYTMHGTLTGLSNADAAEMGAYIMQKNYVWGQVLTENKQAYIPPFRAYITTTGASAPSLSMQLTDAGTTSVQGLRTIDADGTQHFFDLSGRRLAERPSQQGIYINNGRKVIIK